MANDRSPLIWEGRPAWSEFVFLWFFAFMSVVRAAAAFWFGEAGSGAIYGGGSALLIALGIFLRNGMFYRVTRDGIYSTLGLFSRNERVIPIREIAEVRVEQGPLDRLFGIGTLSFQLKKDERRERMKGISNPHVVYEKIMALI